MSAAAEIGKRRPSTRRQRRFALITVALAMLGLAVGLALYALSGSIVFFHTPTEVAQGMVAVGARLRIGGFVKEGSVDALRRQHLLRHHRHRQRGEGHLSRHRARPLS